MITSSTLAPSNKAEIKHTRPLPLSNAPALDFGKPGSQQQLPHSFNRQNDQQKALNQHLDQVVEQQINQITDTPSTQSARAHQHRPLAVEATAIELLDLDQPSKPSTSKLHQHKPLALGQNPTNTLHQHKPLALDQSPSTGSTQHQYKPLALERSSSLDIQLLTEQNSAILTEPAEQFGRILQDLLKQAPTENTLYWIEGNSNTPATQIASKDSKEPSLAWQDSLWF